ncbi:MAG TPA: hypothetical protein VER55_02530 [Ardenticatenaceae bacterium]|nr:hypothetical protein [Ardenticatenaceae bacterium]
MTGPPRAASLPEARGRAASGGAQTWYSRLDPYGILALVLTLFAWAPLLAPTYFMGAHDAPHSLFYPIQFDKSIRDGFWLPRWGPDFAFGYGYPVMVFYAPLAFYVWEGFHLTSLFGVVASTKATFVAGFLLAAAGMYAYGRDLWGRRGGLLASVVYTYLPYHLLNIYVRAALAEFVAMGLLPWIALAFRRLIRNPSRRALAAAAGGYGALLATHNSSAVLFTPFLGATILFELALAWRRARPGFSGSARPVSRGTSLDLVRRALHIAGSIILGLSLAVAIWLPALAEQEAIRIEQWSLPTYQYEDHFVVPSQLLSPAWGFGYSVPGPDDGMSFHLGLPALGLALVSVAWAGTQSRQARTRTAADEMRATIFFMAACLIVLVALVVPASNWLWRLSPLSALIQFPWRVLGVAALPLALLAGGSARAFDSFRRTAALGPGLAALVVIAASAAYTQPQPTPPSPRHESAQTLRDFESEHPDMVGMVAQTRVQPTGSPMLPALEADETPQRFEALSPGVTVTQVHSGGGSASARVAASQPATIRFLTYYYPGWYATLDGQRVPLRPDGGPLGLIEVDVPVGEHLLALRFGDPPLRQAANFVSLASLLLVGALVATGGRNKDGTQLKPEMAVGRVVRSRQTVR